MTKKHYRPRKPFGRIEQELLRKLSLGDLAYGFLLSSRSSHEMMRVAKQRAKDRYRKKLAIERLRASGYISGKDVLSLTLRGKSALEDLVEGTRTSLHKKVWDRKWRIVAFDIPEQFAGLRDRVRAILKKAGFIMLQNSIWIFPHDCEELVQLIRTESNLSRHILYGVLERIEGEEKLRARFKMH